MDSIIEGENSTNTDTPSRPGSTVDENVPSTSNHISQPSIKHIKKLPQRYTIYKSKKYGTKPVLEVPPRHYSRGTQTDRSSGLSEQPMTTNSITTRSQTYIGTDRNWTTSEAQTEDLSRYTRNIPQHSYDIMPNIVGQTNNARNELRPSVLHDNTNTMNAPINLVAQPQMQLININTNIPIAVPLNNLPLVWQGTNFGFISLSPYFLQNQSFINLNSGMNFQ